ncbi:hypothetical protein XOCgx_2174 [Xanthomonas oryzae pv. oryzicola]|nr:hypothetical protein XOCgx_2174 [Xanthomonas oryzae pv. oryzicola]
MAAQRRKSCATHWPRPTRAADCCLIAVSTNDASWRRSSFRTRHTMPLRWHSSVWQGQAPHRCAPRCRPMPRECR